MRTYGYLPSVILGNEPTWDKMIKAVYANPTSHKIQLNTPVFDQGVLPNCVGCSLADVISSVYTNHGHALEVSPNSIWNLEISPFKSGLVPKEVLDKVIYKYNLLYPLKIKTAMTVHNNIDMMKQCLLQVGPIMSCLRVKSESMVFWKGNKDINQGQAVTIFGYDDLGFMFKNSWGVDYGNEGYYMLPYSDVNLICESWTILV